MGELLTSLTGLLKASRELEAISLGEELRLMKTLHKYALLPIRLRELKPT
jgi:hypothetical protein